MVFREPSTLSKLIMDGLDKLVAVMALSDPEDSRDGARLKHRVKMLGYSVRAFDDKHRDKFCDFVTKELGLLPSLCEVLSVDSAAMAAGNPVASSSFSIRRVLDDRDAIDVKYTVWYKAEVVATGSKKGVSDNVPKYTQIIVIVAAITVVVVVIIIAIAGVILATRANKTAVIPRPDTSTNLSSTTESENRYMIRM